MESTQESQKECQKEDTKSKECPVPDPTPGMSELRNKLQDRLFRLDEHKPQQITRGFTQCCRDVYDLLMALDLEKERSQNGGIIIPPDHPIFDELHKHVTSKFWDPMFMFQFYQVLVLDQGTGGTYWIAPHHGDNIVFLVKARYNLDHFA